MCVCVCECVMFPLSLAAQNNCFVDEHTARKMCHAPKDTLPSLMEISARAVLGYDIPWVSSSLPLCIEGKCPCVLCVGCKIVQMHPVLIRRTFKMYMYYTCR